MKKLLINSLIISLSLGVWSLSATDVKNAPSAGDDQIMLIESLKKFVDDNPAAADEMEYVITKKEDAARQKMNDMLEKMGTSTTKNAEELTGGTLDFISRHLNLALVYFYEAKYWLTIEECNSVVKIDPKNTLAWIRRGSAYYMIGQYPQAKKDWMLAIGLGPKKTERMDLERFLAKIESVVASEE